MTRTNQIFISIFISGLIIVMLPDKSDPVITFNEKHGPSLFDLSGLLLMLISWAASCVMIINRRKQIIQHTNNNTIRLLIFVYFMSLAGIIMGLLLSLEWMLWLCVIIAAVINTFFIVQAFRQANKT